MRRLLILMVVSGLLPPMAPISPMAGLAQAPPELSRYETQARDVTVIRDKWGIPHIYGKTDAAAVFGLLYTECENDFARVEKNYLEMLGRQAEAYGEGYVYNDVMMRLIYDSVQARAEYQQCPAWMHKLLDAFADGINYYLYQHPETRPLVLKHFEPWYALMFTDGSVSATSTGGIRAEEIKDFYGGNHRVAMAVPRIDVTEAEERETGSNGFAIAASRTAAGHTLLYINPHVPYYFRMEVQLVSEEGLNAYGAVTWGQFFIYQGFNAHCGWMHTSSYADVADVYAEKISRRGDDWVYEYEGQKRSVTTKPFTVWYQKDGAMQSLPLTGYYTHHGPVLASRDGKWLSLKEYNRSLNALLEAWEITKANSFDEYKTAMDIRANTTNNTVFADDQGNIAYWHGNFIPVRDRSYNWSLPVDGSVAATEWKGLHGLNEIVHVYNPATGWIQNCNSTPFSLSGSSSPDKNQYPAYMAPDGENFRALNAVRLLSGARELTLDSLIAKGYDHYLTAFDLLIPALLDAYDHSSGDLLREGGLPDSVVKKYGLEKALAEAIGYLRKWDRRSAARSVATTLAIEWGTRMTKYAPRPRVPEDATQAVENLKAEIAQSTPAQKVAELAATILDLEQRYAMWWKIEWGDLCHYQRLTGKIDETYDDQRSSMGLGQVPSSFGALPSVQSKLMKGTKIRYAYSGNSFVAAVEFGPRLKAKSIVTGGESSDPDSKHFTDQAYGFFRGEMKDVLFYKADVLAAMEEQYHPGEARVVK